MKFDIKSALPTAAVALVAVTSVAKLDRALAQQPEIQPEQLVQDDFSSFDKLQSNDSFGACDSNGSSDSCGAGDSFGSTPDNAVGYGVWTIERDTTPNDQLFTPTVHDTICFKSNANQLVGQVKGFFGAMPSLMSGSHYAEHGIVRLQLSSDQSIPAEGKTNMVIKRPTSPSGNYWTGIWGKGSSYGELRATLSYSETPYGNAYDYNGCGFVLGY